MIAPLTDEKIPAPPPKDRAETAPPEYDSIVGDLRLGTDRSAFDAAMFTPDVAHRASVSSSSSFPRAPSSQSTRTLASAPTARSTHTPAPASRSTRTSTLSPSSSRTPSSPSPSSSSHPHPHPHSASQPDLSQPPAQRKKKGRGPAAQLVRAVSLAIVVPTLAVGGVTIAATGAALYGSGKLVEGVGRAISVGPELAWKAYRSERGRKVRKALGGGGGGKRAESAPARREKKKGKESLEPQRQEEEADGYSAS